RSAGAGVQRAVGEGGGEDRTGCGGWGWQRGVGRGRPRGCRGPATGPAPPSGSVPGSSDASDKGAFVVSFPRRQVSREGRATARYHAPPARLARRRGLPGTGLGAIGRGPGRRRRRLREWPTGKMGETDSIQMALAAMFTVRASRATLKKNEMTPWAATVRRISFLITPTSDTWEVIPITREK